MKLHFTERAAEDLEAIHSYLVERSPSGARNVHLAMQATFAQLADFPYSGRAQTIPWLRKLGVPRYPYNIYYTVERATNEVIVITVRHAARALEFDDG